MATLTAMADRLLAVVVPRISAAAQPCPPANRVYYQLCYCKGGLRYSERCIAANVPRCGGALAKVGCRRPCIVTGTCP